MNYYAFPFILALLYLSAPVNWYFELDSDRTAALYVDKEDFIRALTIAKKGHLDAYTFFHPSVNYRAKNLRKDCK